MSEEAVRKPPRAASLRRWWGMHAIATVDHVAVVHAVEEDAVWSPRYLFMVLMSAGIALLGLLLSSPAVVIGAMLISPLMGPILGLGFALALFDFAALRRSATALALGAVIAIGFTALVVLLSPIQTVTPEIAARTRPNLFDLLVALFSAMAGSYALIRGRGGTIVGVAIATALMPPLAVVGFGLATWNGAVFGGSLLLFITNLITIALTATAMARLYGFGGHLSPHQTRMQGGLLVAAFVVLAVPLALALRQIAWEAVAARQARSTIAGQFGPDARITALDLDYRAKPLAVRAEMLTPRLVAGADLAASKALSQALGSPASVRILQVRIAAGTREADAAQLAAVQQGEAERVERQTGQQVADRLALVAGVAPDAVTLDIEHRRAVVRATELPGATLAAYRVLEARAAAGARGWTVELIPPVEAPMPAVPVVEDSPSAVAIATAIWAAKRLALPIEVTGGSQEQADAVVTALTQSGISASARNNDGGAMSLAWSAPGETSER